MKAALATLVLGFILGYLGQRSRLCFVAGYRDLFLLRDAALLKGIIGAFVGAVAGFAVFRLLGGMVPGFPLLGRTPNLDSWVAWLLTIVGGLGVGFAGALAGGCPFRMHVLAAEGKKTYWYYLLGFYAGLVFYNLVTFQLIERLWALE
jgi:uncharacterized membrane protein YedE/YeeE